MSRRDEFIQIAETTPFEPNRNPQYGGSPGPSGIVSEETQSAIEEINNKITVAASPSFNYGRGGNSPAGSWLINHEVPSNIVGIPIGINNPVLIEIWAGNENVNTFSLGIYEHEGDEINLTLITTVNIIAARTQLFSGLSLPITKGRQIAVKLATGSAKNVKAFILIKGNT